MIESGMDSNLVARLREFADGEPAYISLTLTEAADRLEALEADSVKWQSAHRIIVDLESRIEALEVALRKIHGEATNVIVARRIAYRALESKDNEA